MRVFIEPWAAEYGGSLDLGEAEESPPEVDDTVEQPGDWDPVPGADDGMPVVCFVDGVRRPDARLTLEVDDGVPVPGVCGSYAVGATRWHRTERRSEVCEVAVHRVAVAGDGLRVELPTVGPGLSYEPLSTPERGTQALVQTFHGAMRRAEAELAEELARAGYFTVVDGPINILSDAPKVGFIKTHRAPYLPPERSAIIGQLSAGERTPMFAIPAFERYSWYLCLARPATGGHAWSGVVRCEVSHALGIEEARRIADRTAAILPETASQAFRDPRAPQNLVPIAGLERALRARLGQAPLLHRHVAEALALEGAAA